MDLVLQISPSVIVRRDHHYHGSNEGNLTVGQIHSLTFPVAHMTMEEQLKGYSCLHQQEYHREQSAQDASKWVSQ